MFPRASGSAWTTLSQVLDSAGPSPAPAVPLPAMSRELHDGTVMRAADDDRAGRPTSEKRSARALEPPFEESSRIVLPLAFAGAVQRTHAASVLSAGPVGSAGSGSVASDEPGAKLTAPPASELKDDTKEMPAAAVAANAETPSALEPER